MTYRSDLDRLHLTAQIGSLFSPTAHTCAFAIGTVFSSITTPLIDADFAIARAARGGCLDFADVGVSGNDVSLLGHSNAATISPRPTTIATLWRTRRC